MNKYINYSDNFDAKLNAESFQILYGQYKDAIKIIKNLKKENEQLKQQVNCHKSRIQLLSPLLDLADTIIDLSDDEKAKAFWEKRNNEVEQEWNKILKGDLND